jgi:hypothetical protein
MEMVLFINSRCKTKPSMPRTSNLTMLNAIPFYELPVQTLLRDDPANFTPTPFNGYSINELSQVLFSPILLSLVTSVESCYLKKGKCTSRALFQIIQAGNGGQQPILPISFFFFFQSHEADFNVASLRSLGLQPMLIWLPISRSTLLLS